MYPWVTSSLCRKSSQNLAILALGHLSEVKRAPKLSRDLIELLGGDVECSMRFLQANRSTPRLSCRVFQGSTRDVADPQAAHKFQPRQSAQIVGMPFPKDLQAPAVTESTVDAAGRGRPRRAAS